MSSTVMQADPLMIRGLANRYGKADREICRLIEAMTEVRTSPGKKTVFGADRHDVAVKAFVKQLFRCCTALIDTRQLNPAAKKAASLSALNSIIGSYRLAYSASADAFTVWDDFFKHQLTVEPDKPWLQSLV
jgi:hypothetical protein